MRIDYEMLLTAVIAAIVIAIADFGAVSKSFDSLSDELAAFRQSEAYRQYAAFKSKESSFWADLKGEKTAGGDLADVLKDAPANENPAAATNAPAPAAASKISGPVKYLMVGDSMMLVGFGPALENSLLKQPGASVVREGAYSTGLNRIDYFDWFTKTDELIARHRPDVLIVMFGANDGQGIVDRAGKTSEFGSAGWSEAYRQRVAVYLARVAPKVKKIYWVGNPIAGSDSFTEKFSVMNPIYKAEIAKFPNAVFVDTWERFAVNGVYRQSIPDDNGLWQIAKQSDGVHVTDFGGAIMTGLVIREIAKDIEPK
ncbi:MAG: DUF459 domain-containing protein [Acidobacteria bacterium]|nr:DUF459 domain-containing protein [Acidobacteriota bacterium]